jgi:hypothetical protein
MDLFVRGAAKDCSDSQQGLAVWSQVNVQDLADGYLILLESLLKGKPEPRTDADYYFFAENGEFAWGEVSKQLGHDLHKRGLVKSAEVKELSDQEAVDANLVIPKEAWALSFDYQMVGSKYLFPEALRCADHLVQTTLAPGLGNSDNWAGNQRCLPSLLFWKGSTKTLMRLWPKKKSGPQRAKCTRSCNISTVCDSTPDPRPVLWRVKPCLPRATSSWPVLHSY